MQKSVSPRYSDNPTLAKVERMKLERRNQLILFDEIKATSPGTRLGAKIFGGDINDCIFAFPQIIFLRFFPVTNSTSKFSSYTV